MKIAVMASGRGSNFEAIINNINSGYLSQVEVEVFITDKAGCGAAGIAEKHGIPVISVNPSHSSSRRVFDAVLISKLKPYVVDYVILAGYMRVLSYVFLKSFPQRVINIHPSLLPSFPGLRAQKQALETGVKVSGCTVHIVDEEVDNGPILLQRAVPVFDTDDEETLSRRILAQEHLLYPKALKLLSEKTVNISGRVVSFS